MFAQFLFPKTDYKQAIGNATWLLLHALADHYPNDASDEITAQYATELETMIQTLKVLYPCAVCREHLAAYIADHPPRLDNRAHAVRWIFNFHNHVNRTLRKPELSAQEYSLRLKNYSGVTATGECSTCQVPQ